MAIDQLRSQVHTLDTHWVLILIHKYNWMTEIKLLKVSLEINTFLKR